jgi:hypothetical protein
VWRVRRRLGGRAKAAVGVRSAPDAGGGERASAHRAPLLVWDNHLRHAAGGSDSAGAIRPRITAIILYLYGGQFLSKKRTAAALAELFGTRSPRAPWQR